jgi:hypothetical protein
MRLGGLLLNHLLVRHFTERREGLAIRQNAFDEHTILETVQFDAHNTLDPHRTSLYKHLTQAIRISDNVTAIPGNTFRWFQELLKVSFGEPASITSIGSYCFAESGVVSMRLPRIVEVIEEGAFQRCRTLKEVEIAPGSRLNTIGKLAFDESALNFMELLDSLLRIEDSAFQECWCLQVIDIRGLTAMGALAFSYSGICSLDVPATLTRIPLDAFGNCLGLAQTAFHEALQEIGGSAFAKCTIAVLKLPRRFGPAGGHPAIACPQATRSGTSQDRRSKVEGAFTLDSFPCDGQITMTWL